jgi:acyl-CoA synthetase (AMP-forming)/AMP-acid ligase II
MNPASMSTKNVPALSDQDRQTPGTQTTDASRTNPSAQLTISGCLAGAARLYGKRQALAAPFSKSLNYRQLFGQITSSVEALNNLGIGRGDRLALVLSGGLHTGMTFLGVAAGATCAPLNPRYREQEFASLFTVLRPKAVIVGTECRSEAFLAANQLSVPVIELSALKTGSQKFVWHGKKLGAATQGGFAKA